METCLVKPQAGFKVGKRSDAPPSLTSVYPYWLIDYLQRWWIKKEVPLLDILPLRLTSSLPHTFHSLSSSVSQSFPAFPQFYSFFFHSLNFNIPKLFSLLLQTHYLFLSFCSKAWFPLLPPSSALIHSLIVSVIFSQISLHSIDS